MSTRRLAACAATVALVNLTAWPEDSGVWPAPPSGGREPPSVSYAGPTGRHALRGPWFVRLDRATRGGALGWRRGGFPGRAVTLPYSPNARRIASERSFQGSVAWYRTAVTAGATADYAIRFESVNHRASVWVDGRLAGRHAGAYLPFEVRTRLRRGRHQLVVRSDWRDPRAVRAAGWYRHWFNFGGINREVTIRRLGASELDAPGIVTRVRDGAAVVAVTVRVRNRRRARTLRVQGTLRGTRLRFPAVRLDAGATAVLTARARIARPALWSPGHPALHDVRLSVPGRSAFAACRCTRTRAGAATRCVRPISTPSCRVCDRCTST